MDAMPKPVESALTDAEKDAVKASYEQKILGIAALNSGPLVMAIKEFGMKMIEKDVTPADYESGKKALLNISSDEKDRLGEARIKFITRLADETRRKLGFSSLQEQAASNGLA